MKKPQPGGFLPIFWDVPRADTHAVEDIGAVVDWLTERCDFRADAKSSLAVLHNRNDMTNLFRASNWVSASQDSIVSRGVTTCAGMSYSYPCPNQSWFPDSIECDQLGVTHTNHCLICDLGNPCAAG